MDLTQGHHDIVMPSHEELQAAEKDLNHILMIKAYLAGIGLLRDTLEASDCTSQLCRWVLENCGPENTAAIASLIGEAIEEDATYSKAPIDIRNNRLWAVKVGAPSFTIRFLSAPDNLLGWATQCLGTSSTTVPRAHQRDARVCGGNQQGISG